jgi:hypothetical protein
MPVILHCLQGNSGIAGAAVALTGAASSNTISDGSGNFSFCGLSDGNYTITPSLVGWSFSPTSQNETLAGVTINGINFVATPNPATVFRITIPSIGRTTFCDVNLGAVADDISGKSCRVFRIVCDNSANGSPVFVKAYSIGQPVVGTTPPQIVFRVDASSVGTMSFPGGVTFPALSVAAVTTGGDSDNSSPVNPITCSVIFKVEDPRD